MLELGGLPCLGYQALGRHANTLSQPKEQSRLADTEVNGVSHNVMALLLVTFSSFCFNQSPNSAYSSIFHKGKPPFL